MSLFASTEIKQPESINSTEFPHRLLECMLTSQHFCINRYKTYSKTYSWRNPKVILMHAVEANICLAIHTETSPQGEKLTLMETSFHSRSQNFLEIPFLFELWLVAERNLSLTKKQPKFNYLWLFAWLIPRYWCWKSILGWEPPIFSVTFVFLLSATRRERHYHGL